MRRESPAASYTELGVSRLRFSGQWFQPWHGAELGEIVLGVGCWRVPCVPRRGKWVASGVSVQHVAGGRSGRVSRGDWVDGVVRDAACKFISLVKGEISGPAHSQLSGDESCSSSEMIYTCAAGRYGDLARDALKQRRGVTREPERCAILHSSGHGDEGQGQA